MTQKERQFRKCFSIPWFVSGIVPCVSTLDRVPFKHGIMRSGILNRDIKHWTFAQGSCVHFHLWFVHFPLSLAVIDTIAFNVTWSLSEVKQHLLKNWKYRIDIFSLSVISLQCRLIFFFFPFMDGITFSFLISVLLCFYFHIIILSKPSVFRVNYSVLFIGYIM